MIAILAFICYTNLAGNVISAAPTKVEGARVWFGAKSYSMKLFPESERKRIKADLGIREIPGELKALAEEIASQRQRVEARNKAGRMTAEKLAEYKNHLRISWEHAVDVSNLKDEDKTYWKGKCP